MNTYDVFFQNNDRSNNKGFECSFDEAIRYINTYNGTKESYFKDYKGGVVKVVCNQTGEVVHEELITTLLYNVDSPDGVPISYGWFWTPEQAMAYYEEWKKGYEKQGYYSANSGRIGLIDLDDWCELISKKFNEEEGFDIAEI